MIRVAGPDDAPALAELRALWVGGADADLARRVAAWLEAEGRRRTTWLAEEDGAAVGMTSLFEYWRMPQPGHPDVSWGYLGNMFVREEARGRGLGTALLDAALAAADERGYVRVVLSPSERAIALYARAGFVVPDDRAPDDRLLVRPGSSAG